MTARTHEEHEETIGAYVLGALPELEAEVFERHLASCASCNEEASRLRVAADALPRSVEQVLPPDTLKASLMETVRGEAGAAEPEPRPERRLSLIRRLTPDFSRVRPAVAMVGASFLLAIGVAAGFVSGRAARDDGSRTVKAAFDATPRMAHANGNLVIPNGDSATATLRLHGMPSLPRDETYQVWVKRHGEVVPQAIFNVSNDGTALTAVGSDVKDADGVLVTREPAGGSRAPSSPPVVSVPL
jgi:anti-sigma-K factor RskA